MIDRLVVWNFRTSPFSNVTRRSTCLKGSFSLCTCWSSSRSLCSCSVPESSLSLERVSGTEFEHSKKGFVKFIRIPSPIPFPSSGRSEEHTSELQSRSDLVCRLLLEKKKHT